MTKKVYMITKDFPKEEMYGLVNQMRRSAVSIPSNIAEGRTRHHTNEYVQFLYVALGSCAELETQAVISRELSFMTEKICSDLLEGLDHIGRMLRNLIKSLRQEKT